MIPIREGNALMLRHDNVLLDVHRQISDRDRRLQAATTPSIMMSPQSLLGITSPVTADCALIRSGAIGRQWHRKERWW
jgi:hypothetical protein